MPIAHVQKQSQVKEREKKGNGGIEVKRLIVQILTFQSKIRKGNHRERETKKMI